MARKKSSLSVVYVGTALETEVIGLAVFKHGEPIAFEDPEKIAAAEELLKTNTNFKLAESQEEADQ